MHVRTRHDHLRPFRCTECGNTFGRLSHLKKHVRKVCGENKNKEKPIAQCRFCDVVFPTKGDLRKHLLTCEKKEAKVNAKVACVQCMLSKRHPQCKADHIILGHVFGGVNSEDGVLPPI